MRGDWWLLLFSKIEINKKNKSKIKMRIRSKTNKRKRKKENMKTNFKQIISEGLSFSGIN